MSEFEKYCSEILLSQIERDYKELMEPRHRAPLKEGIGFLRFINSCEAFTTDEWEEIGHS